MKELINMNEGIFKKRREWIGPLGNAGSDRLRKTLEKYVKQATTNNRATRGKSKPTRQQPSIIAPRPLLPPNTCHCLRCICITAAAAAAAHPSHACPLISLTPSIHYYYHFLSYYFFSNTNWPINPSTTTPLLQSLQ